MSLLRRLIYDEEGQGLIEYSLILAVIAIVIIAFATPIRNAINSIWTNISSGLNTAAQ